MGQKTNSASGQRFSRQAKLYILGLLLCAIAIYSFMLARYFHTGIDFIIAHDLRSVAARHDEQIDHGQKPVLPADWNIFAAYEPDQLPEIFSASFPTGALVPLKLYTESFAPPNPETDAEVIFLLSYPLVDGRTLFLGRLIKPGDIRAEENLLLDTIFTIIIAPGLVFLSLGVLAAYLLNRSLSVPTLALSEWARRLEISDPKLASHPDFRFAELNAIADRLATETSRLAGHIQRERNFLRHASHELRTPIAVIRGTLEVIQKRGLTGETDDHDRLGRIQRATTGMQNLVETILWLSREEEPAPETVRADLAALVTSSIEDHAHLLRGKTVTVETNAVAEPVFIQCALVPAKIIIANLIRNAFQHTAQGEVEVVVTHETLVVRSTERGESYRAERSEISEGLGISLVRRIAERMGWDLLLEVDTQRVEWTWSLSKEQRPARPESL